MVTSPRCFPYTTTCLRVRQSPKGKDYVVGDMALEFGPPSGTGKLIPLLLDTSTSSCRALVRNFIPGGTLQDPLLKRVILVFRCGILVLV